MLRTALAVGLFTSSTMAEPRLLSPDATSVLVQEGTARLISDDTGVVDGHITLLPEGVFYTREGHDRLVGVTTQLQETLQSIRVKLSDYERTALTPCPAIEPPRLEGRWSTGQVILAVVGGILVGAGGYAVWQSARAP